MAGSKYRKIGADGEVVREWAQSLSISRVMQVYRSACIREALRRDEKSEPYLQRRDHMLRAIGAAKERKKNGGRLEHLNSGTRISDAVCMSCADDA
eukprot:6212466-Pleurochrysis_carterae.AAC.1